MAQEFDDLFLFLCGCTEQNLIQILLQKFL